MDEGGDVVSLLTYVDRGGRRFGHDRDITVHADGRYLGTVQPPSLGASPLTWTWVGPDAEVTTVISSGLSSSYEIIGVDGTSVGTIVFSGAGVEVRTTGGERASGPPRSTSSLTVSVTLSHGAVTGVRVTEGPWRRRRDRWELTVRGELRDHMRQLVAWLPVLVEHRRRARTRIVVTGLPGGR